VHLASFAGIVALFASAYAYTAKPVSLRVLSFLYLLACIPVPLFSGSRAGLFTPLVYFGVALGYMLLAADPSYAQYLRVRPSRHKFVFLVVAILVLVTSFATARYLISHSSWFGHMRSLDVLRSAEERRMGGGGADPLARVMVGPMWVIEQIKADDPARRLLLGDGFYGRIGENHTEGGWGLHNSVFFPWQQAGFLAFLIFLWIIVRVVKMGAAVVRNTPPSERWSLVAMVSVLPGAVIVDLGSGTGMVWMSNLVVTGTAFLLTVGVVLPYKYIQAHVLERACISLDAEREGRHRPLPLLHSENQNHTRAANGIPAHRSPGRSFAPG
jgi:hypothetical protein